MGRVLRPGAVLLALVLALAGLPRPAAARTIEPLAGGAAAPASAAISAGQPRLLVKFAATATPAERERAIASVGGTVDRILDAVGVTRIAVPLAATEDPTGLPALQLARDPAVVSVEPDSTGAVQFAPNDAYWLTDPSFGIGQWGLRAAQVDKAWDVVRGAPIITVAVIDTGIDPNHPDLAGVALPGVTFVSSPDPSCPPASVIDHNRHRPHPAALIAANRN